MEHCPEKESEKEREEGREEGRKEGSVTNEHKNKENRNVKAHFEIGSNKYFHYII